jgi:hypothetical protein
MSVTWVCQQQVDAVADIVRRQSHRVQADTEAECRTTQSVVGLIGADSTHQHRQAVSQGPDEGARSTVEDHQLAVGQDLSLRKISFDADVGRLLAEFCGIDLTPNGDEYVDW